MFLGGLREIPIFFFQTVCFQNRTVWPEQKGERRAQFVAHIGEKAAFGLVQFFQFLRLPAYGGGLAFHFGFEAFLFEPVFAGAPVQPAANTGGQQDGGQQQKPPAQVHRRQYREFEAQFVGGGCAVGGLGAYTQAMCAVGQARQAQLRLPEVFPIGRYAL